MESSIAVFLSLEATCLRAIANIPNYQYKYANAYQGHLHSAYVIGMFAFGVV